MSKTVKLPSIFLSHSSADKPAAIELKRRILASPTAKEAGLTVWLDVDDLRSSSEHWQAQIEGAISTATCFAVYVGSGGVLNWMEREIRIALSRATVDKAFAFVPIVDAAATHLKHLPAFAREYQALRDPLNNEQALIGLIRVAMDPSARSVTEVKLVERPFVGLQTMTEKDSDLFFGREEEISELVSRFSRENLVAIVADSGSGKSSLAQAGYIPAFRGCASPAAARALDERNRHVIVMRPGTDPLEGLRLAVTHAAELLNRTEDERNFYRSNLDFKNPSETAYQMRCGLPAGSTLTLLVIDQFEEALTAPRDDKSHDFGRFLEWVIDHKDFRVLITVRQDYFNLLQRFERIYARLTAKGGSQILRLKRISDAGLESIICQPLLKAGYRPYDESVSALVASIRNDMSERPGDLTLVQATLDAVWRNRKLDGGLLEAYAKVGGVAGALANEAETTRGILDKAEQEHLLATLVRLIRPGGTAGATRRIAPLSEFQNPGRGLIQKLAGPETQGGDRLAPLLFVGDQVEIAHEALITQWGWLQEGLQEVWSDVRTLHRLIEKAESWSAAASARKDQHLATGAERAEFWDLFQGRNQWLSYGEIDFIEASQTAFSESEETARKIASDRARQNTSLRRFSGALIAAVVVLLLSVAAIWTLLGSTAATNRQLEATSDQLNKTNRDLAKASEIVKRQADEAKAETQKVQERSALLAANVAKNLIEDGSIDQALLLLLSGATSFDDRLAPDEVLIGLDNALRKRSLTETYEIGRAITAFDEPSALYLFDQITHDVLMVRDQLGPSTILRGKPDDQPLLKLTESRDRKSLFLIRADLSIETVNTEDGSARRTGRFRADPASPDNDDQNIFLSRDGIAMRSATLEAPKKGYKVFVQIIDAVSGKSFDGPSFLQSPMLASDRGANTYVFEPNQKVAYKVVRGANDLTLQRVLLDRRGMIEVNYNGCAAQAGKTSDAVFKIIQRLAEGAHGSPVKCRKFGDQFLVTTETNGSVGILREDSVVPSGTASEPPKEVRKVRDEVENELQSRLSRNNLQWVGMDADGELLAVISNRDVVVVSPAGLEGQLLNYRHPTVPAAARFVGSDKLVVAEADTGTLVAHDLRTSRRTWQFLPTAEASELLNIDGYRKIDAQTLHFGVCEGSTVPASGSRIFPDGTKIEIVGDQPEGGTTKSIRFSFGGAVVDVDPPTNLDCLQFSPDSKELVVTTNGNASESGLALYNRDDLQSRGSFMRAAATKIPFENVSTVFFAGKDDLVVTNGTNRVFRVHRSSDGQWSTTELFRGQNPIFHAEADDDLNRLIVIENIGVGDTYGYLYSISARQKWTDLGRDYKFLRAVFLSQGEIAVSKHGQWSDVFAFAPLSTLVKNGNLALQSKCLPVREKDYRSSRCWPSGF